MPIADKIQELVDLAQEKGQLPGISALVTSGEQTIYFGAQGKRAIQHEDPVSKNDQWHLGSDTKAMTAFLTAIAVQEGKIKYDSPVTSLLKLKSTHPLNQDLTIQDLLSHTSGLKDVQEIQNGKLWKDLFKSRKSLTRQRLEMSKASFSETPKLDKKTQKPDRNFNYANINYIVLGHILETAYNKPWEAILTKKVFNPLSMNSCGFGISGSPKENKPTQPWPHIIEKEKLIGIPPKEKLDNPPMLGPAGTVHCNLMDWHKFILEVISMWRGKSQIIKNKIVSEKYFMKGNNVYTYGGWGRDDEKFKTPLFQHSGSNTFNYATAEFLPEKNVVILLATNRGDKSAEKAIRELLKSIERVLFSAH